MATCKSGTLVPNVTTEVVVDATTDGVMVINLTRDGRIIWASFDAAIDPLPNVDNCYPILGSQVFAGRYGQQHVWLRSDAALQFSVQARYRDA